MLFPLFSKFCLSFSIIKKSIMMLKMLFTLTQKHENSLIKKALAYKGKPNKIYESQNKLIKEILVFL